MTNRFDARKPVRAALFHMKKFKEQKSCRHPPYTIKKNKNRRNRELGNNQPLRGRFGKAPAKPQKRGVGIGTTHKAKEFARWYSR